MKIHWVSEMPSFALCLLCCALSGVSYAEDSANNTQTTEDNSLPSIELLKYLAEFQTEDGQWVDPLDLIEIEEASLSIEEVSVQNEDVNYE